MGRLRPAQRADIPALQNLIARSARELSRGYYTPEQTEALLQYVFGVDTQLIEDQTYFLIEHEHEIVACGGWSKRATLFGGDQAKTGEDLLLDPAGQAARIRAFFVDPRMARRGLGGQLMAASIDAAKAAGFKALELASTLPGEHLYLACGFAVTERFELTLPGDVRVPLTRMIFTIR
jgi:N-acetylglutamate synthase-like GNAT family acetyltransferase